MPDRNRQFVAGDLNTGASDYHAQLFEEPHHEESNQSPDERPAPFWYR